MENIIVKLLEEDFVRQLFEKEILSKYHDFKSIEKIKIEKIKKLIWLTTYHVVFKYDTTFINQKNKKVTLSIYCSAHSTEPRQSVHEVLEFLWQHDFANGRLSIPHPLFYSKEFNATFYRGVKGHNLYHYIKENNFQEIENLIPKTAAWFAKLHQLNSSSAKNFNPENSRIATVVPGLTHIMSDIQRCYPEYSNFYQKAYQKFIEQEETFLKSVKKHWLVHGDAHPENIIKMSKRTLAVIDFTDFCLSDFARDLGTFLQQLEYMSNRKINDPIYTENIKHLFLSSYLKYSKIKLTPELQARIDTYYNWTAMRTANYFLMKHDPQPERAKPLIEQVSKNLNLKL